MKITFAKPGLPATGVVVVSASVKVGAGSKLSASAVKLDNKAGGALSRAIRASHFEGKSAQTLSVLAPAGTKLDEVMIVGLGRAAQWPISRVLGLLGSLLRMENGNDRKRSNVDRLYLPRLYN